MHWVLWVASCTLMITAAQHNRAASVVVDPSVDGSRAPPLITATSNSIDEAPTVLIAPASPGHQQLISAAAPCDTDTGGTCLSFPYICDASRNAVCEWGGVCVCGSGQCVANGACVAPTAAPTLGPGETAAPSIAPTAAPTILPNTYCNWEPASLFAPAINCSISNPQCRWLASAQHASATHFVCGRSLCTLFKSTG